MSAGEFPKDRRISPKPVCPDCGINRMRRLPRAGFWQERFWPLLGMYPWECPTCRKPRLIQYRGGRGGYGGPTQETQSSST